MISVYSLIRNYILKGLTEGYIHTYFGWLCTTFYSTNSHFWQFFFYKFSFFPWLFSELWSTKREFELNIFLKITQQNKNLKIKSHI